MLIAAVAAGLAVWVLMGTGAHRLRSRPEEVGRLRSHRVLVGTAVVGIWMAAAIVFPGGGLALAVTATLVFGTVAHLVRHDRQRRAALRTERSVEAACQAIAAELRAGRQLHETVGIVARDHELLVEPARRIRIGQDPREALCAVGQRPGAAGLVDLGRGWAVAERTGAPASIMVERVVDAVRERTEVGQIVAAEMAAPRATGQVLGILPFAGLVLGAMLGVDPLGFLLHTVIGQVVGVIGVGLACAGLVWSDRLAREHS